MKLINKIYLTALVALVAMIGGCQEDSLVQPGASPSVPENNIGVFFPSSVTSVFEMAPEDAKEIELTISRQVTDQAVEVPLKASNESSSVFVLPETVHFDVGQATTTFKVTFEAAELGVEYNLNITADGLEFINPYDKEHSQSTSARVIIIKWNDLGNQLFFDTFAFATETAAFYAEVKLEQRDDIPSIYRISYPYTDAMWDAMDEPWAGGRTQDYIIFEVNDKQVTWNRFWYTSLLYQAGAGADIKAYLPSALDSSLAADDKLSVAIYEEDSDDISYIHFKPYYYIDGVGGFGLKDTFLSFPGTDLRDIFGDFTVIK